MNAKLTISAALFIVMILVQTYTFAETIYLKDGTVVKEKIVERGDYYIITISGDMRKKYYDGQIERIEEDEQASDSASADIDLGQFEDISQEKAKLIVDFIDASGVRTLMERNINQVIERADEDQKEKLKEMFNINEIIERLVPVYDNYYSEEDLKEIVRFFQSPAGSQFLENTPQIMKDAVGVSVQYLKDKSVE